MKQIPPIKAVMTPFPHSVQLGDPLRAAGELMREHEIRHLPVMEDDRLVGVISDRDLAIALGESPPSPGPRDPRVRDVRVSPAYAVELTEPLDRVLLEMARRQADSVVVLKRGRLVGIFTVSDACRRFGEFLRMFFPAGGHDEIA